VRPPRTRGSRPPGFNGRRTTPPYAQMRAKFCAASIDYLIALLTLCRHSALEIVECGRPAPQGRYAERSKAFQAVRPKP